MQPTEIVWLDGEFVPWDDAHMHVMSVGLNYGAGAFEGIRSYMTEDGPAIFRLHDHLKRLQRSAKIYLLDLLGAPSTADLAEPCKELLRRNGLSRCYIRPIIFLGLGELNLTNPPPVHVAIACWPWE